MSAPIALSVRKNFVRVADAGEGQHRQARERQAHRQRHQRAGHMRHHDRGAPALGEPRLRRVRRRSTAECRRVAIRPRPARAAAPPGSPARCRSRSARRPRRWTGHGPARGSGTPSSSTIACAPAATAARAPAARSRSDPCGQEGRQQQWLVAGLGGAVLALVHQHGPSSAPPWPRLTAWASIPRSRRTLGQRDHRGRLAGAARIQVADADHRHADPGRVDLAPAAAGVAPA